jgi:23S rRNA (guanine1835-N2)-methyltransferase
MTASPVTETTLVVPQGSFRLQRFPLQEGDLLRAWDAADDYMLHHVHEHPAPEGGLTWIVNDGFGALTVALTVQHDVHTSSDSWLAHEAIRANLQDNELPASAVQLLTSLESPAATVGAVLIKIPKSLALLEDQLHHIRSHLRPGVPVIGAGMTRGIHTSTLQLFEQIIGPTTTSLARRKARLVLAEFDAARDPGANPFPSEYDLQDPPWKLLGHAGLFSHARLDVGTRKLLAQIPSGNEARDIVDLGCGNGVIGLVAAERNPQANLSFVDESFRALASARANWQRVFGERSAWFQAGDGLDPVAAAGTGADLVLCNPPFHDDHAMGDATAWRMFTGGRRVLCSGGELIVVGNRHLAYHAKLRRIFGNCEVLDSDSKFVVLRSRR